MEQNNKFESLRKPYSDCWYENCCECSNMCEEIIRWMEQYVIYKAIFFLEGNNDNDNMWKSTFHICLKCRGKQGKSQ